MNIGQKIKKIREQKKMTQSTLAGEVVTRNMLSQIENGVALPSIQTLIHIAQTLGVSVGYLFADDYEDILYLQNQQIEHIKRLYKNKEYKSVILAGQNDNLFDSADDELQLILCDSYFKTALEHFKNAYLVSAHSAFNLALRHSEKTIYSTKEIKQLSYLYLWLIHNIDSSFSFDKTKIDLIKEPFFDSSNAVELYSYILCETQPKKYLSAFEDSSILQDVFKNSVFADHARAKYLMEQGDYLKATEIIRSILFHQKDHGIGKILEYKLYCDLDICYMRLGDFKNAHTCASLKADILKEIKN